MKETTINELGTENRKGECNLFEQLKVDQEFAQEKIDSMADTFIKCLFEMSRTFTNVDEKIVISLIQILLLKNFTNMSLSDDLMEIIATLKPIEDEIGEIMKKFPEGEILKAVTKIKLTSIELEKQWRESEEYASLSNNESVVELP